MSAVIYEQVVQCPTCALSVVAQISSIKRTCAALRLGRRPEIISSCFRISEQFPTPLMMEARNTFADAVAVQNEDLCFLEEGACSTPIFI